MYAKAGHSVAKAAQPRSYAGKVCPALLSCAGAHNEKGSIRRGRIEPRSNGLMAIEFSFGTDLVRRGQYSMETPKVPMTSKPQSSLSLKSLVVSSSQSKSIPE